MGIWRLHYIETCMGSSLESIFKFLEWLKCIRAIQFERACAPKKAFSKIESYFNWLSWQNISTATKNYKFKEIFKSFTADITLEISHQMIIVIRIYKGNVIENVSSIVFIPSYSSSYSFGCAVIWSRTPRSFKSSLNWSTVLSKLSVSELLVRWTPYYLPKWNNV